MTHLPVLVDEACKFLDLSPGRLMADLTVGGGGHARLLLQNGPSERRLIALDWDEEALERARVSLGPFLERVEFVRDDYKSFPRILSERGLDKVDGIIMDMGVSSFHLDDPERGFSFQADGPLDMRMDRRKTITAEKIINRASYEGLVQIFRDYGEERWSGPIARKIIAERCKKPLHNTLQLANIVCRAIPKQYHPRHIHPATRIFQALRIAVNKELEGLEDALEQIVYCLSPGGVMVVISFHSLEDRVVKSVFNRLKKSCRCPPVVPVCCCGGKPIVRLLCPKPVVATQTECRLNPRSRSARLRAVMKIGENG
jgi:16S rRNA (cytosine1402-N4)-methyltransferase